jgi:uncharacterized protein (TIGR03067 family)
MRTSLLVAAVAVLLTGFAPAPFRKPDSGKDDLKKMQGSWLRLSSTNGALPPVATPINDTVVITGDRINFSGQIYVLTLGRAPGVRTFDFKPAQSGKPVLGGKGWLGVYELKGDSLRVCFANRDTRPRGLQPTLPGEYLQTFTRKKP